MREGFFFHTGQSHCTLELQDLPFSGWDQLETNIGFHACKIQGTQTIPATSVFFISSSQKCAILTLGLVETKLFLVFFWVSFQPNIIQAGAN